MNKYDDLNKIEINDLLFMMTYTPNNKFIKVHDLSFNNSTL